MIDFWCMSCDIVLRWKPLDLTHDKSALVQVMAWCRQTAFTWANTAPFYVAIWRHYAAIEKENDRKVLVYREYHKLFILSAKDSVIHFHL